MTGIQGSMQIKTEVTEYAYSTKGGYFVYQLILKTLGQQICPN